MPRQSLSLNSELVRGAIVLAALAAVALPFLLLRDDGASDTEPTLSGAPSPGAAATPDVETGALDDRQARRGQPAPDFVLRDLDGATVRLSDLLGKVVYVNFWATWCGPCKKELPAIEKIAGEYPDDLVVLAINWRESAADARGYLDENDLELRVLLDSGGVYDHYRAPIEGLPLSFFIDRAGNVAALQYGELNEKRMRERLAEAGLE
jgi:thiol-disulfide isomerase/thioredoxin